MRIFPGSRGIDVEGPFAVAIGIFDGVHRGHQALLREACALAAADGVESLAYTFHPHPAAVLAPERAPTLIEPIDTRLQRLAAIGVRSVLVEPFDPQFAAMSPEDFVRDILVAKLQAVHVVIGEDFTFGHRGAGDVALLQRMGEELGFSVHPIRKVEVGGVAVSSTRVRELVRAGAVRAAAELLGHPFSLVGRVIRGAGRGSTIGIPTANLDPHTELTPGRGVYAAFAEGPFGRHQAVVNVGVNPTFQAPGGRGTKIEAHVLDLPPRPLYGAVLSLELIERLRDERRFDGVEALKKQIDADIQAARGILAAQEGGGS